jgi:hypothetical protein
MASGTRCECAAVGVIDCRPWVIAEEHCALHIHARRACGMHTRSARSAGRSVCTRPAPQPRKPRLPLLWGAHLAAPFTQGQAGPVAASVGPTGRAARQERALGMLAARLGRAAPAGAATGAAELVIPWLLAAAAAAERRTRAAALAALRAVQVRVRGGAWRARSGCRQCVRGPCVFENGPGRMAHAAILGAAGTLSGHACGRTPLAVALLGALNGLVSARPLRPSSAAAWSGGDYSAGF